jgi:putative transposase
MTRINIGPRDRVSDAGSDYRLVMTTDDGVVLARVGAMATELNQNFTHQQIKQALDANLIRIDRGWYEEERARARLMAGVSSLAELPRDEVNEMLREQYYCDEFLKREALDKKVKRTDASIAKTLQAIDAERPVEGQRCDRPVQTKPRPSARTFRRWLRLYEVGGYDILALRKKHRNSGNRVSPIHPEAERILQKSVVGYCDERRKSKKALYGEMRAEFKQVNDEREARGLELLTCPAKSTLSARIDALNAFEVYASRYGVAKARAKFAVVGSGLDVVRPLQHIQIDEWRVQLHTIAEQIGLGDVLTEEERIALKKERLYITVVLDVATRCILAMRLSSRVDAANAIATLAMVVSDKNNVAKAAGCLSDWPMGGAFGLISPDAGSAFIDERFRACVADLKAVYENAPAALSHLRGHIERTLGSMHTTLMGNFPGRTFSNVVDLAEYKAEDRAAIFSRHVPQIFVRWAVDWYHHSPHAGLGGETPYNAWQRLTAKYGVDAPPNGHQRREIFGIDLERSLDQRGVRVAGIFYQSPEIQEWRRQVGDTKVRLRFDPSDIGYVSVWIGERWLTVPSVQDMYRGLDLQTWLESVKDIRRRHAENAKVSEHIVLAAIRAISQMADNAMRRVSIDATRPTAEEIEREERHLLLGFEIADKDALVHDEKRPPKANILDGAIPVASARPPVTPTALTPRAPDDGDYGLED